MAATVSVSWPAWTAACSPSSRVVVWWIADHAAWNAVTTQPFFPNSCGCSRSASSISSDQDGSTRSRPILTSA